MPFARRDARAVGIAAPDCRGLTAIVLTALAAAAPAARAAAPGADPDWPCMMIRVSDLSLASAWAGPSVAPYLATWSADPHLADLIRRVTERRTSPAEAGQAIQAFADASGMQRRDRLLALMAGAYSTLADERRSVMAGLDRLGRRQKELATEGTRRPRCVARRTGRRGRGRRLPRPAAAEGGVGHAAVRAASAVAALRV